MSVLFNKRVELASLAGGARTSSLFRRLFWVLAAFSDGLLILIAAVMAGTIYHLAVYGSFMNIAPTRDFALLVAALFVLINLAREEYTPAQFMSFKTHAHRVLSVWNMAFLAAFALGFFTRTADSLSRGSIILFFFLGFGLLVLGRYILVRSIVVGSKLGRICARRIMLVGNETDVLEFARHYQPWNLGLEVAGMSFLGAGRGVEDAELWSQRLSIDLERAVTSARAMRPDDIFVVVPWSQTRTINRCVDAFMNTPASIHLAPERILDRFDSVSIAKMGHMSSLNITRPPLSLFERLQKRSLDIAGALIGLLLLSPLLLLVALAIKLDSRGPVFFLQQRYGFNQKPFRIFKFRSMSTLDDGHEVRQATRNDSRVTRTGGFLRRWNLDELPQLINVLLGQMSIVGPRPHAVAHNRSFERRIALYARRHNVKPGITGWAQVNGWRGETDTEEKMKMRVDHDLFYIDNWSLLLDLKIIFLTVFSAKAYKNAL